MIIGLLHCFPKAGAVFCVGEATGNLAAGVLRRKLRCLIILIERPRRRM
jgi:hypothetical protein